MIRPERPGDSAAIHAVHRAAFPTDVEARLVDKLRENGQASVSIVAEEAGHIVGHILFSRVTVTGITERHGLGLAPVAILPNWQRRGLGSALIQTGIYACRRLDCGFVVVLGHPEYYPRFGFVRASACGLTNEYGVDEAFMVLELKPHGLPAGGGLVRYGPEFAEFV